MHIKYFVHMLKKAICESYSQIAFFVRCEM